MRYIAKLEALIAKLKHEALQKLQGGLLGSNLTQFVSLMTDFFGDPGLEMADVDRDSNVQLGPGVIHLPTKRIPTVAEIDAENPVEPKEGLMDRREIGEAKVFYPTHVATYHAEGTSHLFHPTKILEFNQYPHTPPFLESLILPFLTSGIPTQFQPRPARPKKGRPTYLCVIGSCEFSGQNKPVMFAHARRHLRTCLGCPYCPMRCFNSESWERHVRIQHGPDQVDKSDNPIDPHPQWRAALEKSTHRSSDYIIRHVFIQCSNDLIRILDK